MPTDTPRMLMAAVAVALVAFVVVLVSLLVFVGNDDDGGDEAGLAARTASASPSASGSPTPTATGTPSVTPTPSPTPTPTATPTPTPTPTATPTATSTPTPTPQPTLAEPFAFCAARGTVDAPTGSEANPARISLRGREYVWRCWEGKVLGCQAGATSVPCAKVDVSRTATTAAAAYCQNNPDVASVPRTATGQASIYEWACQSGVPFITRQLVAASQIDNRGYVLGVWEELRP